jgi:putative ABC transport system permease protein
MPFQLEEGASAATGARLTADVLPISNQYFQTLRIPVIRGRSFEDADSAAGAGAQNAVRATIVNETFARRFFGRGNPIGRSIWLGEPVPRRMEIVGVVGDTLQSSLTAPPPALVYLPFGRSPFWFTTFVARSTGSTEDVLDLMRRELARIAPGVPLMEMGALGGFVGNSFAVSGRRAQLLGAVSGVALVLSAVSLYGILAYLVVGRRHEIGVRLALGARPGQVMWLVFGRGLALVAIGSAIGLVLSLGVGRLLKTLLFGVDTLDVTTLVTVLATLAVTTALACWLPARRAASVDPMIVLRNE